MTYENAQARERTQILMDLANMEKGLVVGTGDLSELALGWSTYNGDHMSMYGVNGGIPKTLIREMIGQEAARAAAMDQPDLAKVLRSILHTPVSPELLPTDAQGRIEQKTEASTGPYILNDFFLYHLVGRGAGPLKLLWLSQAAFLPESGEADQESSFTEEALKHWLLNFGRRFFSQQFKRSCQPDGPQIGTISLSPRGAWQMPSDMDASFWKDELEEI